MTKVTAKHQRLFAIFRLVLSYVQYLMYYIECGKLFGDCCLFLRSLTAFENLLHILFIAHRIDILN